MSGSAKISDMTPATALTGTEAFETVQGGTTAKATATQLRTYAIATSYTYNVPSTGFSLTYGAGVQVLLLEPAGTLATGTVTMPASPADGDRVKLATTQTITALTLSPNTGQSIVNAVTTLAANGFVEYIYRLSSTKWYRIG